MFIFMFMLPKKQTFIVIKDPGCYLRLAVATPWIHFSVHPRVFHPDESKKECAWRFSIAIPY